MKIKKILLLMTLAAGALVSLSNLSKSVSGESEMQHETVSQPEQEKMQQASQTVSTQESQAHRPYQVLPVEDRRLSQEAVDQIDNLTIQQFVQFFNDTGLDVSTVGTVYFVNDPDGRWVLPSNNYVEGEFPIIGFNRDGSAQGWDNYLDGDSWTTLDYSDSSKAATIGQIKQALYDYFEE